MKRLSWKYIAGLVDGEACIDLQIIRHKDYPDSPYVIPRVRITLVESCRFLLEILDNNFDGGIHDKKREFENPKWQNACTWGLYGKKARPFLQNIVNHLYIKKEQARLAIWMIDNIMGKCVSIELREHLNNEIKAMKRDPQRLSEMAVLKAKEIGSLWSKHSNACLHCGRSDIIHEARGLCRTCYNLSRKEHGCDSLANRRLVGSME